MMLAVNLHDRIGDSLDLLSMLSNGLVAMLGGYAMRVDRPRKVLEGFNILLDFRKDMLPPDEDAKWYMPENWETKQRQ